MKTPIRLLFFFFSFCFAQSSIACSCTELPNTFCGTINEHSNVGKITVLEHVEFVYENEVYRAIKVAFDELLQGTAPEVDLSYQKRSFR